jgi:hypothetical protein
MPTARRSAARQLIDGQLRRLAFRPRGGQRLAS